MKKTKLALLAGAAALAPLAATAATAGADHHAEASAVPRYTAEQFYESNSYSTGSSWARNFTLDGDHVLVRSDETGVHNIYLMPVGGGAMTPLTASTDDARYPIGFFPGDDRLLFTGNAGGNELWQLYVRELDGTVRDLTEGTEHRAGAFGWSADGKSLYIGTNERDASVSDIYKVDLEDYSRELVWQNPGGLNIAELSEDGRWLVLSKSNSSADNDLFLVDLAADGAEPKLLTDLPGNTSNSSYGFDPDGGRLYYGTDAHGEFRQVWGYDLATGEHVKVHEADWDVTAYGFSPEGKYLYRVINADGLGDVTLIDRASGREVALPGLPQGNLVGARFDEDNDRVMVALGSDTSPTDLYMVDLGEGTTTRLTTALNPAIDEAHLVPGTMVRFASYDDLEIPGILYRPHGASADNPAPAVVYVHGGPGGQTGHGYNPSIQHLVNAGYAVYGINNRGSSGYGKTFYHMDDKRHGEADLDDVTASAAWLKSLDWVADDRIAIMGGSYGGYMTAAALAFRPEVFDAGINIFGVTNWVRTLESIPAWWGPARAALYDELGDPAVDGERLRAISPLFHASNIVKPMLVVQGANDPRVLQVESDELVEAVRANDVPVNYVLFDDEGHGFSKKANRIAASEAYVAFLDEHIGTD
ncbi:S9 family peptidase [Sphingomicrobium aestuariivivum]|uniref:S9 family peptidase n=1 Tax=Sphingomicrobium aestuariivivum TaxID=1582356 RepID=UPI001FD692C7|nr:S9 family peptidase [Sphingomicrobium aestuariivivum]MCJ8191493.1 S9 family peptidase [Sphingomicrobium aestuariivivum]